MRRAVEAPGVRTAAPAAEVVVVDELDGAAELAVGGLVVAQTDEEVGAAPGAGLVDAPREARIGEDGQVVDEVISPTPPSAAALSST